MRCCQAVPTNKSKVGRGITADRNGTRSSSIPCLDAFQHGGMIAAGVLCQCRLATVAFSTTLRAKTTCFSWETVKTAS